MRVRSSENQYYNLLHFACWVKKSADNILKYFFLVFLEKKDLTLHANCLLSNLHEVSDPLDF